MINFPDEIETLSKDLDLLKKNLDLKTKETRMHELEAESVVEGFWDNQERARGIMQEIGDIKNEQTEINELEESLNTLKEFSALEGINDDLESELGKAKKLLRKLEIASYFSGKYDKKNCIFSIHAGQGGTEAMDWASMLYRMYTRYFEKKGWKCEILDMTSGDEAGIKSVVMQVSGQYSYGYLKHEIGAHRLVRQSPFNADNLRQTSFALVEVLPELEEADEADIEIRDEDLDWQFYRSSGKGGQNVNKVSTAVRLKHIPSGIVVTSQTQRHQEQNRANALSQLRAKLWAKKQEEEAKTLENIKGGYTPASWGNQIRSYVLHPYKMIKDLRTGYETSDTDYVLDGGLDEFIEASLKLK